MSKLKSTLTKIAAGHTSNHPLIRQYLEDDSAQEKARLVKILTERQGRPAKQAPSSFLLMLD